MSEELGEVRKVAQLPSIALEPELNEKVRAFAQKRGIKLARLMRLSLEFYLSRDSVEMGNISENTGKTKRKGRKS